MLAILTAELQKVSHYSSAKYDVSGNSFLLNDVRLVKIRREMNLQDGIVSGACGIILRVCRQDLLTA